MGQRLRAARLRAGLSQTEAARRLGIHQSRISDWERGRTPDMLASTLRRLRGLYGCSADRLIG